MKQPDLAKQPSFTIGHFFSRSYSPDILKEMRALGNVMGIKIVRHKLPKNKSKKSFDKKRKG